MILFAPLLLGPAIIHTIVDEFRASTKPAKPKPKPVYVMQSSRPRPSHRSSPRTRDAEFYRDRRVKKAIRKLPF